MYITLYTKGTNITLKKNNIDSNVYNLIIECISWLIKVTDNNDAQWKPEIQDKNIQSIISQWGWANFWNSVYVLQYILNVCD
jgi:superfamily I DNA and/or RNA helicase